MDQRDADVGDFRKLVHTKYVEGLEEDRGRILEYFGKDFVAAEMKKAA